jgi:hypothetical protein
MLCRHYRIYVFNQACLLNTPEHHRIKGMPSSGMLLLILYHIVFPRSVRRLLVTANVVPSSPIHIILMMEELRSSTRRNIPEDGILHSQRRENLKSYITKYIHYISRKYRNIVEYLHHISRIHKNISACLHYISGTHKKITKYLTISQRSHKNIAEHFHWFSSCHKDFAEYLHG